MQANEKHLLATISNKGSFMAFSLTNEQYNIIQRYYDEKRLTHQKEADQRKAEIYNKIPAFRELELEAISISMAQGKKLLSKAAASDNALTNDEYHKKILDIKLRKNRLLEEYNYPKDYLDIKYDCLNCKDTGYVEGRKCSCFIKMQIDLVYNYSQMTELIKTDNFDNLSKKYYSGESLELFNHAEETCKNFIKNFNSDYHNLLFYGTVGTGKSFLSSCVAKELLEKDCSIIYVSAIQLFQVISNHIYDNNKEAFIQITESLVNSDLLIIDDLGTESNNDFVRSRLFDLINERIIRHKSIIISTNLSLEDIRTRYSDRVFSRIYGSFELLHLAGVKDIRIQKKLEEIND